MLDEFGSEGGAGQRLARSLRATLLQAEEAVSDLADGTEALKRNFLFRGFFRSRGFYDLDALTRDAYTAGALEGKDRTALRVWIDEGVLFARDGDRGEQLTDAGRRRIDTVMSDFLRYPRDSPLIVEGYAAEADASSAYLRSADRGTIVRDYIRERFRRRTTLVDFIPMGDRAIESPSGDNRWSGVALTLFVRHAALAPEASRRR
jgi:phospholipid/cholesterol/gamma-HCH transport system substrate-binding protein